LRNLVQAVYPEAVGRRRAEAMSAQATAELLQLVPGYPPTESHQALVQVCRAPTPCALYNVLQYMCTACERKGKAKLEQGRWAARDKREGVCLLSVVRCA
jgi:hypothetical protein